MILHTVQQKTNQKTAQTLTNINMADHRTTATRELILNQFKQDFRSLLSETQEKLDALEYSSVSTFALSQDPKALLQERLRMRIFAKEMNTSRSPKVRNRVVQKQKRKRVKCDVYELSQTDYSLSLEFSQFAKESRTLMDSFPILFSDHPLPPCKGSFFNNEGPVDPVFDLQLVIPAEKPDLRYNRLENGCVPFADSLNLPELPTLISQDDDLNIENFFVWAYYTNGLKIFKMTWVIIFKTQITTAEVAVKMEKTRFYFQTSNDNCSDP